MILEPVSVVGGLTMPEACAVPWLSCEGCAAYVDFADVREVIAGIDTISGLGMIIFDDIRLYAATCVPELGPAADFTGDCVVDLADFAVFAGQWRESPRSPSADIVADPPDGFVDGQDLDVLLDSWLDEQFWPP
jgi:hypothetical protein